MSSLNAIRDKVEAASRCRSRTAWPCSTTRT